MFPIDLHFSGSIFFNLLRPNLVAHTINDKDRLCSDACSAWMNPEDSKKEALKLMKATAMLHSVFIPQFCENLIFERGILLVIIIILNNILFILPVN